MRPTARLLIAATLSLLASALGPYEANASSAALGVPEALAGKLAATVESGVPGAWLVVTNGADVVVSTAAGHSMDGSAITTGTPMRLASASKAFTATAVLQLVQSGKIELDSPVAEHLPEFTMMDPRHREITVRQLLNHSSGLTDRSLSASSPDQANDLQDALTRMRAGHLDYSPGTRYAYSNANYFVAARLVEVVSGLEYADYLRSNIFSPLSMTHTTSIRHSDDSVPGLATGATYVFGRAVPVRTPRFLVTGAGDIVSTPDDMAKWLMFQSQARPNPRVLDAVLLRESHRRQAPDGYLYALGWNHGPSAAGGPPRTSHSGVAPGTNSYVGLFEDRVGIAVATNQVGLNGVDAYSLAETALGVMSGEDPVAPRVQAPVGDAFAVLLLVGVVALSYATIMGKWRRPVVKRLVPIVLLLPALAFWVFPAVALQTAGRAAGRGDLFAMSPTVWVVLAASSILAAIAVATAAARGIAACRTSAST